MAIRPQQYRLKFPLTAAQVEGIDSMFETLFRAVRAVEGVTGARGAVGPIGPTGLDGEDAAVSFIPGPSGVQGVQGIAGPAGMDGESDDTQITGFSAGTGVTLSGVLQAAAGSVTDPSVTWGDPTTGVYRSGTNKLSFAMAGVDGLVLNANGSINVAQSISSDNGDIIAAAAKSFGFNGRGGFTSSADGILRAANNAGSDFNRLQFGGTTSAFPSWQRSGAGLIARLADDSANANVTALATLVGNGSNTSPTMAFSGETGSGWYLSAANTISFTTANVARITIAAAQLLFNASGIVGWTGGSASTSGPYDIQLTRIGTGQLDLKTASATVGIGLDFATDGTLKVRDRTFASDAALTGSTLTASTEVVSPQHRGGTSTTQTLILQTTSGVGAAGADIIFKVGNNGATEAARILNSGNTGIGVTAPTAILHLKAGAATASSAPAKLNSGTNMTTPETGAVEYNGTELFFTRTGTTRESVFVGNDAAAAPATNAIGVLIDYFGTSATRSLNTPNSWASVVVAGTTYKIPLYS